MFMFTPVGLFYHPTHTHTLTQVNISVAGEETVCTSVPRDLQGWSDPFHGPPGSPG